MNIWIAFALVALGIGIDRVYSIAMWRKYYEGRADGEDRRRNK